ncbi:hypothetical protein FQA39_LY05508 [Lamprigera yunnana]|nr:hypothetical protein FQA39_LY05508 [Lamprigera yunnana]
MPQQRELRTVSSVVQERQHATAKGHGNNNTQRPRSGSQIILQPAIPEAEREEDSADGRVSLENGMVRTSFTKNNPSRTNSVNSTKSTKIKRVSEIKGYENGGYDEAGNRRFERSHSDSARSSTHDSVVSLQIQREQYCCCARWSHFERRLALCVGVLAAIIIGLAIAVGLLAGNEGVDERFLWKL